MARKDEDLSAMRKALKAGKHSSVSELFGNWLATLLVSISFLTLVNHTGKALTFWIYAIFAIIGLVFCWFLVPETKGKSLEQIEEYWEH